MAESAELEVVEPAIATVQVTPDEAREANDRINAVIREVLREGQNGDYWRIPGTGQPTLLQPGAETLQRFFGLGRQLSAPELGMVELEDGKKFFSAIVKCSVTNRDGRILSESIGYCDDTEAKRGGGPGSKWRGNRNTIIQMATKRAYVNAIKAATGTSNHFTSDLEDGAAGEQQPPTVSDRVATDAEKLLLAEVYAQKKPATMTEAGAYVSGNPKHTSANWVARQVMAMLLKGDPKPGTEDDPALDGPELEAEPSVLEGEVTNADESIPF